MAGSKVVNDRSSKRRIALLLGGTALVAVATFGPAVAADSTWTGTGGASWGAGANWDTNPAAPTTADRALLTGAGGGNQPTVFGGNNFSVGGVSMTGANTLTIQAGGTLNVVTSGGQSGLFTMSAGTLAGGGNLNVDTFTIAGGTATGVTITAGTAFNLTGGSVSAILAGAGALNASGAVTLSGVNSYTGGTTISGGQLTLGNAGALGNSSNSLTMTGGVLDLGGFVVTQNGGLLLQGGTVQDGSLNSSANFALQSGTVDASLSGASAVSKTTSGTVMLNAANGYTGGTTISGGQLTLGNAGALGNSSNSLTMTGGVLDLGGFVVTQNGGLLLQGGTVQNGTLSSSASFALQSGTVNASLSGAGAVSKTTSGTVTLTAANGYTGGTMISAGAVNVQNGAALGSGAVAVASGAALEVQGGITITNALTLNGTGASGGGALRNVSGANAYAGAITLAANTRMNSDAGTLTLSGGITGAFDLTIGGAGNGAITGTIDGTVTSLTKDGTGTFTLAGNNTYSGATTVNGGTLAVQGSLASSAVVVNGGGVLTGTGVVGATQINAGGALAAGDGTPGASMTLSSLALQAGAQYLVSINPTTSSFANVTGNATLGGATVGATFASGSYVEKRYTILTAGSITGSFDPTTVSTNLPSNFKTVLSYDATHAYLDLSLAFVAPSGIGLSVNQQNVANAITNYFDTNAAIPLVFGGLTPAGLTQLSGEIGSAPQQATFDAMGQFLGVMTDPFIVGRGGFDGGPSAYAGENLAFAATGADRSKRERDAYATMYAKAPVAPSFEQRWSVWTAGFGGSQKTDGNTIIGSNNTTSNLYATAVGADYRMSRDTMVGFALAGGGTSFTIAGNLGGGRSDLFQAGAYFRHAIGPAYVTGALAYGWQDIVTDRTVTVAGADRLRAEFNANAYSGRLEGGYRVVAQGFGWTPYAATQFTTFDLPAYAEQAVAGSNQFALAYNSKSVTDTRTELGLLADKAFVQTDGIVKLRSRVAWAHDFNPGRAAGATFQTLPGASFVVNGASVASDSALLTGAIEKVWRSGWSAAGIFEGEFSNATRFFAGKGVVRYAW
ncbi:autotransporter domain-containing protein [Bradyrhizobium manausense]|uniref:autotransporter outer membrane beta-barrel domain-containing protein n=1 Tax=Bradyrhizobium manausense TaxID=989370 RepID=UPI001BA74B2E|nr:autotransporter outer membrane beta-barrel domain-containing protein [Bradyrhizobium manausense]MBR0687112.1 autotransporter domain-containing protein [Bradyrhizobium manausense]